MASSASAATKRCYYEVLGISRDASPDEIRSSYKKLALQRHPDKLMRSGITEADATAQFQELVHAYEVLSDSKERAWYDSHRSQILFSDRTSTSGSSAPAIPDLFSFFSNTVYSGYSDKGKGFYKVYSDVFNKIYANEVNFCKKLGLGFDNLREAPLMGNSESPYKQVTAFYSYWLAFSSVMDFCWADQYDVMAGPDRRSRRLMEEENKKVRKKAKREFNDTVRGLAEFVKKRDKRVIDMMAKKIAETEKKKEEERERKKKLEREKMERMMAYEEPEWVRAAEEVEDFEEENGEEGKQEEFYCVACGKKFKSDKQWKNHEQSKKHKEKVAQLRESFQDEEDVEEEEEEFVEIEEETDDLEEKFEKGVTVSEEDNEVENLDGEDEDDDGFIDAKDSNEVEEGNENDKDDGFLDAKDSNEVERANESNTKDVVSDDDDEMSVLEAMLSGRRGKKNRNAKDVYPEDVNEGAHVMNHDRKKSRRRAKKERGKADVEEPFKDVANGSKSTNEETKVGNEDQTEESCPTISVTDNNANDIKKDDHSVKNKKGVAKKETNSKAVPSKGKKGKGTSKKAAANLCETCGEEFESRNKLHMHLGETGHASLKRR
ncbi:DNAJ protein JJJ1 homolog [Linum grandiflorum]